MTRLKKSAILSLIMFGFLFRCNEARAIPIPTIGAELATQIDQLTKHIDELKKVKDQITNGIEQAKAMGDKLSMDALKNFASGQLKSALSGSMKAIEIPQEMSAAGLSEDVMKDPEKVTAALEKVRDNAETMDERRVCWDARDSMNKELTLASLANSFALQQNLASGEDMKKAQEATSASDDQMQLLGSNTATLKVMYQQVASSTMMEANSLASTVISSMCD